MRELFEKAASLKPRLIFFDEFELLQFKLLIQFLIKCEKLDAFMVIFFSYSNDEKIGVNRG